MGEQARVNISLREGKLEILGSEDFVREHVEKFKDLIHSGLTQILAQALPSSTVVTDEQRVVATEEVAITSADIYPRVFSFEDDKIVILSDLPGKSKKEKTINAALLYLAAKGIKEQESASFDEIRKVCKDHACLDSANFAATLKKKKQLFIVQGPRRNQRVKLTRPGYSRAQNLVKKLDSQ